MKTRLLTLLPLFCVLVGFSQPANDDCATAQAIGPLPTPAACPSGVGAAINIAGSFATATAPNPYLFMNNCSGSSTSMASPADDLWYTFVATGYQLQVNITGTTVNPNVAMYSGTCGLLGGGVGGCAVGTAGGNATLIVNQMVPGTTYYLQVSNNAAGAGGNFNMAISNSQDCNNCMIGSVLTPNPLPVNGMYTPGQVVNFCFTVNNYSQINTNWMHGVQVAFGSGWAGISGQVGATPIGGSGTWSWFNSCTSTATGQNFGPGFYIDLDGDGNPGNNFGDNCDPIGTGIPCPAGTTTWTFCFNLTVAAACNPGSNLSVTINTSGDGESGSWANTGCAGDPATVFNAMGSCCPPTMAQVPATCAGNDGQATATPVGALGPYEYTWTGPGAYTTTQTGVAGASTVTGLAPGTYTVAVIDNNGCLVTNTVTVTGNVVNPVPVVGSNSPVCLNQAINLTANAGYTSYAWTGPNGFNSAVQNPTITPATAANAGTYTCAVVDAFGCAGQATTVVVVNPLPVVTANNNGPLCPGATLNLTSTAGMNGYSWSGPNAFNSGLQNPTYGPVTAADAGTYTVTVTDANGCVNAASTTVVINTSIAVTANSNSPICEGQALNLTSTPAALATYAWTGPNAYASALQNPSIAAATPAASGTYTITGTDAQGCQGTATVAVVVNPLPVPVANNNGPLCAGANLNLTGGGGPSYSWTGPNGFNSLVQNPPILGVTTAASGTYTLTITTAAGCTATATTAVTINPTPPAVAGSNSPVCNNGTINLTSGGGNTYQWSGPLAFASALQNPSITPAAQNMSGVYTVTVTGVGSCTATATVNVLVYPPVTAVAGADVTICAGQNANLTSVAGGGNGSYTYSWQPGAAATANTSVSPPATQIYTISITSCGETATDNVTVTVNPLPALSITPDTTYGCAPLCVNFAGASVPASVDCDWVFSDGQIADNNCNPNICFNNAGTYGATLNVTDVNGCSNSLTAANIIDVYPNPDANFSASPQPADIFDPTIYFTDLSSGANITNWNWSFGDPLLNTSTDQNPSFNYGNAGTYTVELIVVSDHGCADTTWSTVIIEPNFSLYVPNAFTPDGDGINDDFFAKGEGIDLNNWDMWIYDRWGNMIFYTDDFFKHWDGKVQSGASNSLVQIDVYVWKIKCMNFKGERKSLVGHVAVVK